MSDEKNVDLGFSYNVKEIVLNTSRVLTAFLFYFSFYLVCFTKINFFAGLSFAFIPLITLPIISYYQNKEWAVKIKEEKPIKQPDNYEIKPDFVLK